MSDGLNLLIMLLNHINIDESIVLDTEYTHPLINAAKYLANEYLIGDDGHPDRENIDKISRAGFPIFPAEQDRFGWVTAYIELKHRIIIFG